MKARWNANLSCWIDRVFYTREGIPRAATEVELDVPCECTDRDPHRKVEVGRNRSASFRHEYDQTARRAVVQCACLSALFPFSSSTFSAGVIPRRSRQSKGDKTEIQKTAWYANIRADPAKWRLVLAAGHLLASPTSCYTSASVACT